MENRLKRWLFSALCLLISMSSFALDYESFIVDGIGYKILSETDRTVAVTNSAQKITGEIAPAQSPRSRRTAYIYSYTDVTYSGKVVIPATVTYDGITYIVTSIGSSCFSSCKSLSSITVPNTVSTINKLAFGYCSGLKDVIIEDGTEEIGFDNESSGGNNVFYNCSIDSLYLGRNIVMLNNTTVNGMFPGLKKVVIGDGVTTLPGELFKGKDNLTAVHFGKNITSMGESVFSGCTKLASIDLTSKLTSIPNSTLYNCTALESVVIPDGITEIGERAFCLCSALTSITIPNSVISIGKTAFYYCKGLKEVIIEDGTEEIGFNNESSGGNQVFNGCVIDSLYMGRNIVMLNNTTVNGMFPGLKKVAIGDNVTTLPGEIFKGKDKLTTVHFGKNIATMGEGVFSGCTKLASIDLTSKLTSVPNGTFYNCTVLESVVIPDGITEIGERAFSGCSALPSITIPNTVTTVGDQAFQTCTSLKEFIIEDGTEAIGFDNQSGGSRGIFNSSCPIDSLYLGRNIVMLNNTTVNGMFPGLKKVAIGTHVTSLLQSMFSSDTGLSKIYPLWENPITITKNVFPNTVYANATLLVLGGTVKKYQATSAWNEFANIVPTAIGVTMTATAGGSISLGDEVVSNDTKLLQVKPNSVLTFDITPEDTHFLTSVTVNGEDMTAQVVNGQLTPSDLSEDLEIVATFMAKPFYTVSTTATTGGTATVGNASVMWGNGTTITLTPNEGHELKSVMVNGTDKTSEVVDGVLTLSDIKENKVVVATFQKQRFAVTAAECENGGITLSANEVEWDASATATFTPATHYEVATVSVNGEDCTAQLGNNQLTIANIRQAINVGATFRLQSFTVTETHNAGGSVSLSAGIAQWGSNVTVTMTPDDEYFLESITVNGVDVTDNVADDEYIITVDGTTAVVVTFVAKPYFSVTATSSAGGTATVGSASVMWGRNTTVTLMPDEGYELKSITVNEVDMTDDVVDGVLTLSDIRENTNVVATFGIITETITLAKATGGTYCTNIDLDFSGIDGLNAYIACGFNPDEGVVWMMRVDYVPANEGILIKGTPGTYEVPHRRTGFRYNNMLVGSHVKRTLPVSEDGYYNYVLKDGLFCPSSGSASVGVNKAYLRIPMSWVASPARELTMELIDETTGISGIKNNVENGTRYYNMNGQRVEKPKKGLYIKNGKKIIIR